MIHLILVSHSQTLAEGIYQLARQMTSHPESIHLAAGIDDPENPIGTDAIKIMTAIEEANNPDGILILIDLGSALLSTETALDLLDPDLAGRCKISAAPLVEGSIAAAITAGTGADLESVAHAAESALEGKKSALGEEKTEMLTLATENSADFLTEITLHNPYGLHTRPAALIVSKMSAFQSQIILEKDGKRADGKNINQILALGSRVGDKITVYATGEDASAAIMTFRELAAGHFGEKLKAEGKKNIATATVVRSEMITADVFRPQVEEKNEKILYLDDFKNAIQRQIVSLEILSKQTAAWLGHDYGEIFSAQKMLLEDLTNEALQFCQDRNDTILKNWHEFCRQQAKTLEKLDNPYLQARAADIWDLENAVSRKFTQVNMPIQPFIYVAEDIFPTQVWFLSRIYETEKSAFWRLGEYCKAVVLAKGNTCSHAAILLKALNIPLLVDAGEDVLTLNTGEKITVGLTTGKIQKN